MIETKKQFLRVLFEKGEIPSHDVAAIGKLTMTIIKPGLNKSKAPFYPQETLKRAVFLVARQVMHGRGLLAGKAAIARAIA